MQVSQEWGNSHAYSWTQRLAGPDPKCLLYYLHISEFWLPIQTAQFLHAIVFPEMLSRTFFLLIFAGVLIYSL